MRSEKMSNAAKVEKNRSHPEFWAINPRFPSQEQRIMRRITKTLHRVLSNRIPFLVRKTQFTELSHCRSKGKVKMENKKSLPM
jgi:hypothetical protein